jgi:ankyrin repeat protein
MEGHEAVAQFLISRGVHLNDADNRGGTPLHRAVMKGHLGVVVDLIEAGAAIDRKLWNGYTALIFSAECGYDKIAEVLLQKGAEIEDTITSRKLTPLVIAAINGHSSVVKILLNHNANAHALTSGGETALFLAAYEGHLDIVQPLSTYEGLIDKQSEGGMTPMSSTPSWKIRRRQILA